MQPRIRDAWFKFYPRDYLEKTRQLSLEQRGAYIDCICLQMMAEAPVNDDYAWLAHQLHVSIRKARSIVEDLIEVQKLRRTAEGLVNDRCVFEIESKLNQRRVNAENAAKRAQKHTENPEKPNDINEAPQLSLSDYSLTRARVDSDTEQSKKKEKAPSGAAPSATQDAKGSRLSKAWQLPVEWKDWALENIQIATEQISGEANRFRDYWTEIPGQKGRKVDWAGTWRNWLRRNYPERSQNHQPPSDVKKPPDFWWRTKPEQAKKLPPEMWRKAVSNFANGKWPVETLGPPPGAVDCLVPKEVVKELNLTAIYTQEGIKRK